MLRPPAGHGVATVRPPPAGRFRGRAWLLRDEARRAAVDGDRRRGGNGRVAARPGPGRRPVRCGHAQRVGAGHADRGLGDPHLVHGRDRLEGRARTARTDAGRCRGSVGDRPDPLGPGGEQRSDRHAVPPRGADRAGAGPDLLLRGPVGRRRGHTDPVLDDRRQCGQHPGRPGDRRPPCVHHASAAARAVPLLRRALQRLPLRGDGRRSLGGHPRARRGVAGAGAPSVPGSDVRVAGGRCIGPRCPLPARRGRHHRRGRARRPHDGPTDARPLRRTEPGLVRDPRQPRPSPRGCGVGDLQRGSVGRARLLRGRVLPRRRPDLLRERGTGTSGDRDRHL